MRGFHVAGAAVLARVLMAILVAVSLNACQSQKQLARQEAKRQTERLGLTPPIVALPGEEQTAPRVHYASQTPMPLRKAEIDFYVGMPEPLPGLVEVQGPQGPLWLYPQVILQRRDLSRVATLETPEQKHFVRFDLNDFGSRKWAEVSSHNIGGLMVIVMQDQVVDVARISAPMTDGHIYFPVANNAYAQTLLKRLQ